MFNKLFVIAALFATVKGDVAASAATKLHTSLTELHKAVGWADNLGKSLGSSEKVKALRDFNNFINKKTQQILTEAGSDAYRLMVLHQTQLLKEAKDGELNIELLAKSYLQSAGDLEEYLNASKETEGDKEVFQEMFGESITAQAGIVEQALRRLSAIEKSVSKVKSQFDLVLQDQSGVHHVISKRVQDVKSKVTSLKSKKSGLESTLESQKTKISELHTKYQSHKNQVHALGVDIEFINKTIQSQELYASGKHSHLRSLRTQKTNIENKIQDIKDEIEQIKQKACSNGSGRKGWKKVCKKNTWGTEKCSNERCDNGDCCADSDSFTNLLNDLESELEELTNFSSAVTNLYGDEPDTSALEAEIATLQQQLENVKASGHTIKGDIDVAEAKIRSKKSELSTKKSEKSTAEHNMSSAKSEGIRVNGLKTHTESDISSTTSKISTEESNLEDLSSVANSLKPVYHEIKSASEALGSSHAPALSNISGAADALLGTTSFKIVSEATVDKLVAQASKLRAEVKRIEKDAMAKQKIFGELMKGLYGK